MGGKSRKDTSSLHEDLLTALRRQLAAASWRAAAQDPLFLRNLGEIDEAFMDADAETART